MNIQEIKDAKDQRPFQPFKIRMADGRAIRVTHPDAIAWNTPFADDEDSVAAAEPRTAICVIPGGRRVVIELALVTSLSLLPVPEEGSKKGKGKAGGT